VRRDGFYHVVNPTGGTEGDVNDRDRFFVRGQLLFEPTDALSVRLIGDYTHRDESCCGAVYIATKETIDPTANPTTPGRNTDGAVAFNPTNRIVEVLRSLGGLVTYPPQDPFSRNVTVSPGLTYRNTTRDWGVSGEINY